MRYIIFQDIVNEDAQSVIIDVAGTPRLGTQVFDRASSSAQEVRGYHGLLGTPVGNKTYHLLRDHFRHLKEGITHTAASRRHISESHLRRHSSGGTVTIGVQRSFNKGTKAFDI